MAQLPFVNITDLPWLSLIIKKYSPLCLPSRENGCLSYYDRTWGSFVSRKMDSPLPPDPYKALGVDTTADAAAIKTAYRKLVLRCHPDKFPDPTIKAQKQEEFHGVQQAYEILGSEEKKRQYDLEVHAKKLREELQKKGVDTSATNGNSRYYNVNVRTAEPPPGWSPSSRPPPQKSNSHKPYSGLFSQSWEHGIPSRSKAYHDEGRTARRAASYEKPKREDSRERRRRTEEEREKERRREQEEEEELKRERRQKSLAKERERELRDRDLKEKARKREREEREARLREQEREQRARDDAKREKRLRERERAERERERDAKRKQDAEEKIRAKAKPYVEHSGFSEEDEDTRKGPSKKPSKKHGDSPTRDKPSLKQRDRSGPRDESPTDDKGQSAHEKFQSALAYAAQYVQETKNKAGKPAPKVAPEVPSYSAAYPDPNEKFAPPAAKRRGSGDAKYAKGEPITVDVSGPSKERPEITNVSPTQQIPPRLQKSYTSPPGHMPQAHTAASPPPPPPPSRAQFGLNRSYTLQPDHFDAGRLSGEKHRQSRRRASFDEEDYFEHSPQPRVRKYSVNRDKGAAPRTVESRYKEPYGPSSGAPFPKVKMAPAYGPEHVATAKRYTDPELSEYQAPSYSEYHSTQTAY